MIEVEIRFAINDQFEERLANWETELESSGDQLDCYFEHPDIGLASKDCALRTRRCNGEYSLDYKGPSGDLELAVRDEMSALIQDGNSLATVETILTSLGFFAAKSVKKSRTMYRLKFEDQWISVCLDEVVGLGRFVELEEMVCEDDVETSKIRLRRLADALGLQYPIAESYLDLLLKADQDTD